MNEVALPELGDEVTAQVKSQLDETTWDIYCKEIPNSWTATLKTPSSWPYQINEEGFFWIYRMSEHGRWVKVSDSDYGRYYITDGMRPRYIQALQAALQIITDPGNEDKSAPDHLSDMKGMFNRGVKQDQPDWFTVYEILSKPSHFVIDKAADALYNIARAIRRKDLVEARIWTQQFRELDLEIVLKQGLRYLKEDVVHLDKASTFGQSSRIGENISLTENNNGQEFILTQIAKAKIERANFTHNQTLMILVSLLESNGYIVKYSQLVDAYCRLKTGPAIFEVKSITKDNVRSQCRAALSQLYEYRYLHNLPESSLWVVFSEPLPVEWLLHYLHADRQLEILWIEQGKLSGPSFQRLFQSRSGAVV